MSIRRAAICVSLVFLAVVLIGVPFRSPLSSQSKTQTPTVIAGRNVNMVAGDRLPGGDPWLQRQNEPSIAVSSRNPLHLLAGANDYRTVDMPQSEGELPGKTPVAMVGDAWLGVFTSIDGGESWTSTMLPGFPQDNKANPLKGYRTAADPVVRSGPNGIFYYSGIAFNRDTNLGVVFVARYIDNNNKEGGNTIQYIDTKIIATGTAAKFLDKPWIAVDQPRLPFGNVTVAGQGILRHNVYVAYSAFSGKDSSLGDIMFARSNDCGTTWGSPIKISSGNFAHQGAAIAIKPVLGEVLVTWRRFSQAGKTPDSIFVALSFSRGLDFQSPIKVADIPPFDQPTTDGMHSLPGTLNGYAFRTNSYPTIAVDKSGHVYLAWSQRGVGPSGSARIMISSSLLGFSWAFPQPVADSDENGLPFLGHQIMPSFSFASGKLILVWYDQRHDVSGTAYGFNNWIIDDLPYRHTMDVWAAVADTKTFPALTWKSAQVSRYLYGVLKDNGGAIVYRDGKPIIFPVQFNCVNYPLFKGGLDPFNGDYIDVAASPSFRLDSWRNWIFNTDSSDSPVFHVAWTDNRDVRPPVNGDWTQYTPPDSSQDPNFVSPGQPTCTGGDAPGMRNQNIYTSRITWGIEAGSPVNDKPLNNLPGNIARAFVVFVKNNTGSLRSFRLTIAAQPAGGQASFLQFGLLTRLGVDIAPFSTISRPVFISSSDSSASVTIMINEINASGTIVTGGLTSSVLINGDPANPQVPGTDETHNPNIVNANPNIVNWYVNPNIVNPNIVNPNIVNPNIVNPNIVDPNIVNTDPSNPNIVNPNIVNPNSVNPNIVNYDVPNPNIVNPNIVNPDIVNPNIVNANPQDVSATDVQWKVRNDGTATTSYTLKALAKKSPPEGVYAQLLVYRIHYTPAVAGAELSSATGIDACSLKQEPHHELVLNVVNPNIVNPNIVNPNIVNPNIVNSSIENATFSVAPGEEIIVDLRVLDTGISASTSQATAKALSTAPALQAFNVREFIDSLGFAVTSQAVNSADAAQGVQTPPAAATMLVIGTGSLPDGVVGASYTATLNAYGGTGNYTWSLNSGQLPAGLTLGYGGVIIGTPTTPGIFHFIIRVDDGSQFDTQQYSILINSNSGPIPRLTIVTTTLPGGVQGAWYGATLEATGGVWPRTWSLASGSLPNGLSLDSGGVISGTPTVSGSFSFAVRVTDKNGTTAAQSLSLVIAANTFTYYTISGYTYSETGQPLAGVVLRGLPDTPVTDTSGFYTDNVPAGWSGTVTPFIANHSFSPASRTYQNVTASVSQQNYNKAAGPGLEWTWVSGGNTVNQPGTYGTKGTAASSNVLGARAGAVSWIDSSGNLWLFGGYEVDSAGNNHTFNDLWKYDGTNWTWVSGSSTDGQGGTYGTKGVANPSNVPGARTTGVSWIDSGGNLWLFGGWGLVSSTNSGLLNDLWKFNPTTLQWTWVSGSSSVFQAGTYGTQGVAASSNVPGARYQAASSIDSSGTVWLWGGSGIDSTGNNGLLNDLWKFDGDNWTWVSGSNTVNSVGVYPDAHGKAGVPGARFHPVSWADSSGKFWLFGGGYNTNNNTNFYAFNDLWKYDPVTNEWTWVSGSNTVNQAGNYGLLGTAAASNVPGGRDNAVSWIGSDGKLWLFGGVGPNSAGTTYYFLNDLWKYDPVTNEWTWVSGSNTVNQAGSYGTLGTAAAANVPGARCELVSWIDPSGKLWLFGGGGFDGAANFGYLNDLWQYSLALPDLVVSSLTHSPANPTTADTITFVATVRNIGNATAGPSVLSFQVGGETTPPTYNVPSLAPRATYQATRTTQLTVVQNYQNTATADVTNVVTESNETNNVTTDFYTVTTPPLPDLRTWSITQQPPWPKPTDTITFSVEVMNNGAGSAGASTVRLVVGGSTYNLPISALAAGTSQTVTQVVGPLAYGTYPVTGTADIYNEVVESNETNNQASYNLPVGGPDLVVESLTHSPANPTITTPITVTAVVRNIGNQYGGASIMSLYVEGWGTNNYMIPLLQAGESYTVPASVGTLSAGNHVARATADVNNAVEEWNEGNNVSPDDSFMVSALPDLVPEQKWSQTGIGVVTLATALRNNGLGPTGASEFRNSIRNK